MLVKKEKKKKLWFVTLSPTRIEVTSFNRSGNQILNDKKHALNSGCRCIEDN
jgi:hypothetical protein